MNPTAQKPSAAVLAQLFEPIREDLRGVEREFARHVQSQVALIPTIVKQVEAVISQKNRRQAALGT